MSPTPPSWSTLTWHTPTPEPGASAPRSDQGHVRHSTVVSGGMPIGNGETAALLFPVVKPFSPANASGFTIGAGVHLLLAMSTAMASDTSLMPLGIVSIATEPPLGATDFAQTLDLTNASASVRTAVGSVDAWVDSASNRIAVHVRGKSPFASVNVSVLSLRPKTRFRYRARCANPTSAPDEWSHPTGPHSIGLSHRNEDEDITGDFGPQHKDARAYLNSTLSQQGLAGLADSLQSSDKWRHRTFGLVVSADGLQHDDGFDGRRAAADYMHERLVSRGAAAAIDITITTLAEQSPSHAAWVARAGALHADHARPAARAKRHSQHQAHWTSFWQRSHIWVTPAGNGSGALAEALANLTTRYAQTRYVQAIQAGSWVPIKFNGMLFTAQLPPETNASGPTFRGWGSSNWWQNTRLAYWTMYAPGDFALLRSLLTYFLEMAPLLRARTRAVFKHDGIYTTETATLFGLYDPCDYGDSAATRNTSRLPIGYEENRFIRFDFGGDAGLTELCVMLLDAYLYTLDDALLTKFLPLLTDTLTFFSQHYGDFSAAKPLRIFPTQGLETYQCWLPSTEDNCPMNDHPTVAALHVLTERALELPERLTTPAQRQQWARLREALPPVPLVVEEGVTVVSPFAQYPKASNPGNVEAPELYSTHPFRYFTLGRSRLPGARRRDLRPSLHCLEVSNRGSCKNSRQNQGWMQLPMNAALLGRASLAARAVLERAKEPPAVGYRFPGFAPREQDYEPSEDHWANMMSGAQLMLLQPADDGLESGGALLFPAWPCAWDVDFKVQAPRRTVVSGKLVSGELVELSVEPPERRAAITVMPCQRS